MLQKRISRPRTPLSERPDLTPFAGVLLALICVFLLAFFPKEPDRGLVPLEATPRLACDACFNAPDHTEVFICLTAGGRISFATPDQRLQAAVLRQVGQKHGVHFSAAQQARLEALPYLATRLEQLPLLLDASSAAPDNQPAFDYLTLTGMQLADCLETARQSSPDITSQPAYFYLLVEAQTNASTVMHLLWLLQQRGINRVHLLTHCRP